MKKNILDIPLTLAYKPMFFSCIYFAFIWSTCIKKACAYKQAFTVFMNQNLMLNLNQFTDFIYHKRILSGFNKRMISGCVIRNNHAL